jgi:hypothetical protein
MDERYLHEYIRDPENPETNWNLAIEYLNNDQTASAICFFLRCADRSGDDLDLAYECLIHIGRCFDRQGDLKHIICSLILRIGIRIGHSHIIYADKHLNFVTLILPLSDVSVGIQESGDWYMRKQLRVGGGENWKNIK